MAKVDGSRRFSITGAFLLIFLPLAILAAGIGLAIHHNLWSMRLETLKQKERTHVEVAAQFLSRDLRDKMKDLLFLASTHPESSLLNDKDLERLALEFKKFADIKKFYDQIRLLDSKGLELIRVNFHPGGSFVVASGELQDKSNRDYFQLAKKLRPGQVFISAFDLNVENGRVELPFKPAIRLATPLAGPSGRIKHILILNCLGQTFLDHMKKSAVSSPGKVMLLNRRGYWLSGAPEEKLNWAFMFPRRKALNLPNLWPGVWRAMSEKPNGQFQDQRGIFSFRTLRPYDLAAQLARPEKSKPGSARVEWLIATWVPQSWLDQVEGNNLKRLFAILSGVWLAFALLGAFLAKTSVARKSSQSELLRANLKLNKSVERMRRYNLETNAVNNLSDLVQACASVEEMCDVIARMGPSLFPGYLGELSIIEKSETLGVAARWGSAKGSRAIFDKSECWALRRGKLHLVSPQNNLPACGHFEDSQGGLQICAPLVARGATMGVFSIRAIESEDPGDLGTLQFLVRNVAEMIALSLANIRLRERLQEQSIRDPLTGLFNRRFMEESLAREEARALRGKASLSLIMLDVDHFKRFNDEHGHEVGDEVLKGLGGLLRGQSRKEDIACRYGGEEFLLILPGAAHEIALARAETIRQTVQDELTVESSSGGRLGVTISLGVATLPNQGESSEEVLKLADAALLAAKEKGRNRVEGAAQPA